MLFQIFEDVKFVVRFGNKSQWWDATAECFTSHHDDDDDDDDEDDDVDDDDDDDDDDDVDDVDYVDDDETGRWLSTIHCTYVKYSSSLRSECSKERNKCLNSCCRSGGQGQDCWSLQC